MRLFKIFKKQEPVIDICFESDRMKTARRIVSMIESCLTPEHITFTERLIDLFEKKYDDQLPLRKWLLNKSFDIENADVCFGLR